MSKLNRRLGLCNSFGLAEQGEAKAQLEAPRAGSIAGSRCERMGTQKSALWVGGRERGGGDFSVRGGALFDRVAAQACQIYLATLFVLANATVWL